MLMLKTYKNNHEQPTIKMKVEIALTIISDFKRYKIPF